MTNQNTVNLSVKLGDQILIEGVNKKGENEAWVVTYGLRHNKNEATGFDAETMLPTINRFQLSFSKK